jgi:membrane-associated phospholipid phosphatase
MPPPQIGDARFLADLAEVRRYTESPTEGATRIAKFYDMTTGTMAAGYWNERAAALIRARNTGELRAATLLATMNAAIMDAIVACHDAKYTYWVPRPSQVDPAIKPLNGAPNHPSYPSSHACVSTAAGLALTHFFPQEKTSLELECGRSRAIENLRGHPLPVRCARG